MSWVFIILFLIYVICILLLRKGIKDLPLFEEKPALPSIGFSIIVPFRNEEKQLPQLLKSFQEQQYPTSHYELLLVDDQSTDHSATIVQQFIQAHPPIKIRLISNNRQTNSPKKDALQIAIHQAHHNWIVTTDADCITPPYWLETLSTFIQKHQPAMVVGPIMLGVAPIKNHFLSQFEVLDILSLQGVTMGAFGLGKPLMNNGAHLAFTQEGFKAVQGYKGNDHLASGDDHFLLEKFLKWQPNKVQYLKAQQAIITTAPQNSWTQLFGQRKRWAAKASAFNNPLTKLLALLIFLTNLQLIGLVLYTFIQIVLSGDFPNYLHFLLPISAGKIVVDILFFNTANTFFNKRLHLLWQIVCGLFYPWFTTTVAIASFFGNYTWKERRFKR